MSEPAANAAVFAGPAAYLEARGFTKSGHRTGGIQHPKLVNLPVGTRILRLYHEVNRRFGAWWMTLHELDTIVQHFARGGDALAEGRSEGRGVFQATLAVRHDWADGSPLHLSRFVLVQTLLPLQAYWGEGDVAPGADHKSTQKPVAINAPDGRRPACQLFLPFCWTYQADALQTMQEGHTDSGLLAALDRFGAPPLDFER